MTQIDGAPPSVSLACQMAGGLQSPDIHQCLAVKPSHNKAVTLGVVQQASVSCSSKGAARAWFNDATKRGAIAWEQLEIWPQLLHTAVQLCSPCQLCECISRTENNE